MNEKTQNDKICYTYKQLTDPYKVNKLVIQFKAFGIGRVRKLIIFISWKRRNNYKLRDAEEQ